MNLTITELAAKLGCEYAEAAALVKLGLKQGTITEAGKRPSAQPSGRGKPSNIYAIPNEISFNLTQAITKAA